MSRSRHPTRFAHLTTSIREGASIVAADAMELDLAGQGESQPQIQFDGVMVFGADVEPGHQAFTTMISHELPDKTRSKTFAAMCGMRAYATDLGVAVERQTFATHRDQFPAGSHTIVGAHFARSAAKEARKRERGERNHLGRVCVGEVNNFGDWAGRRDLFGKDHL